MSSFNSGQAALMPTRLFALSSSQVSLASTFTGDLVFAVGQVTNDVVTSAVGASIVVVSTLANIYLTFRRKQTELDIQYKVRFREEMRNQKEKDLRLAGKIRETAELQHTIATLQAENKELRQKLKEFSHE